MLVLPPQLVEAELLDGYWVKLRFADGLAADVDLSHLCEFDGVFEALRDVDFFRRLEIDGSGSTIKWPNEADIAPETLYDLVQLAVHEKRRATAASH